MSVLPDLLDRLLAVADEGPFDDHARWLAELLDAPIGLVTVLGNEQQHFLGVHGLPLGVRATPLRTSLCARVADEGRMLAVTDGHRDRRVAQHPAIRELGLRAYLGVPLRLPDRSRIGAVCVADRGSRRWPRHAERVLAHVRQLVEATFETRLHEVESRRR